LKIRIAFNGILGKMGRSILTGLASESDLEIISGYDPSADNTLLTDGIKMGNSIIRICGSIDELFKCKPDVVIDFSEGSVFLELIKNAIKYNTDLIIGTTGISDKDLSEAKKLIEKSNITVIIAPNFSIGAVLMMKFASYASDYFKGCEIIELHHKHKKDAPSGTAIHTAEEIKSSLKDKQRLNENEFEKYNGARGALVEGIHVHSIRMPGLLAHQEVIFGTEGQTLTIRHDTYDRSAYLPGIKIAIKKVSEVKGMIIGLENLI